MTGRPTKLTPQTIEALTTAIRQGATYELACKYAGIRYNTFNEWRKRGYIEAERRDKPRSKPRDSEQPFLDLNEAIEKAEGEAMLTWLAFIQKAAPTNWQAAAWKLERRYPELYGRRIVDIRGGIDVHMVNQLVDAAQAAGLDASELFNNMLAAIDAETRQRGDSA